MPKEITVYSSKARGPSHRAVIGASGAPCAIACTDDPPERIVHDSRTFTDEAPTCQACRRVYRISKAMQAQRSR